VSRVKNLEMLRGYLRSVDSFKEHASALPVNGRKIMTILTDLTMNPDYANYPARRLLQHLERMQWYAAAEPHHLDDAKDRLAALATVASNMVVDVIDKKNNTMISGCPPMTDPKRAG
jgi:hypothetical protein